ncbi:NAD(P)H-binding protein [Altererythrobacter aurantiacus]|uniref:NAD(P)H-binding protein n=1 Tax=Parapontixanthobacter aurantiacus TaxID=1463599 RepID=A0A844ZCI1_9SPHN|nr:NAD(P)H-binding protein [Parapontixanthobacter aurantiacus]MXO84717.1 NAD(P)H-binding protein [Parapontixanthobacter aurantiacus]
MTLSLTGGTGFVGRAVLDQLGEQGRSAKALTRRPQEQMFPGLQWVEGSLSDRESLMRLCEGADTVLHIAGLTSALDHSEFEKANVEGTRNILEAAEAEGVRRFVLVSSLAAREPSLSAYGASKARAEEVVKERTLDCTIIRPPAVYGPRDTELLDLFRAAKAGFAPVPPKGRASFIHVADLARFLLAVTDAKGSSEGLYEPDDGRPGGYSHEELARSIGAAFGRDVRVAHMPAWSLRLVARADELLRGNGAKLTRDRVGYMLHPDWVSRPGYAPPSSLWKPEIGGEEGFRRTAEWYQKEGWL